MAASGTFSLALEYLKATIAASAAFQSLVGHAGNASAAAAHVYRNGLPHPAADAYTLAEREALQPYAIIWGDEDGGYIAEKQAVTSWVAGGRLLCKLIRECPAAYNDDPTSAANEDWENVIGTILDEMQALADTAGYLSIVRCGVEFGPYWNDPDDQVVEDVTQAVVLFFEWGGR